MRTNILLGSFVVLSLAAFGCAREKQDIKSAADTGASSGKGAAASPAEARAAVDQAVQENQGGGLQISAEIMRLCPGIKPPKFGYDSAELRGEWETALHTLADCMQSGSLAGKGVLLTGHTDPRGDEDYNLALGGRRAEAVKHAISKFGVASDRLDVTSRGEIDAVGNSEETWARDRRVDLDLRPEKKK